MKSHYAPVVLDVENVNEAYFAGLTLIRDKGALIETRNGPARKLPGVLITHYRNPRQRFLMLPERDCNPVFHLLESLWMLSGSNELEFPAYYVPSMKSFSDDGATFNGAYGFRWRQAFGVDQIEAVIKTLADDPNSRRVVVQMWDSKLDLMNPKSKDLCCNLLVKFYIVDNMLMMDVCCRSNDMVFGGYGANAVHFSFLQEYICDRLRHEGLPIRMGVYNQISMDAHMYTGQLYGDLLWTNVLNSLDSDLSEQCVYTDAYSPQGYRGYRLVTLSPFLFRVTNELGHELPSASGSFPLDLGSFDYELAAIVKYKSNARDVIGGFKSGYFNLVIDPMLVAYDKYKAGNLMEAVRIIDTMRSNIALEFGLWSDQRLDVEVACSEWLERRVARRLHIAQNT